MSTRTLAILAAVLVALVGGVAWQHARSTPTGGADARAAAQLGFAAYTKTNTDRITITQPKQQRPIVLERHGDGWKLGAANVAQAQLDQLFTIFHGVDDAELVSRSAASRAKFNVTATTGVTLELAGEPGDHTFLIGAPADASGFFFVRALDGTSVYEADGDLTTLLGQEAKAWKETPPPTPTATPTASAAPASSTK